MHRIARTIAHELRIAETLAGALVHLVGDVLVHRHHV